MAVGYASLLIFIPAIRQITKSLNQSITHSINQTTASKPRIGKSGRIPENLTQPDNLSIKYFQN